MGVSAKELTLLMRTLVILEGVISTIAPDINILDIAIPYVKANSKESLLKIVNLDELAISSYKFLHASMSLPNKVIELLNSIHMGRTKIQLEHTNLQKPINEINKMVNRLVFSIIVASMIIASSLILNSNIGPKLYNISLIGISGYFVAAFLGFWLLISIIKSGKL